MKLPLKVRRLLWFIGLWLGGVLTITLVGLAIRWAIMPD